MERNSLDLHLNSVKMFSLVAVFLAPLPLIKGKFQYLLDYVRETRYNLILELFFSLYPTTIERKNFLRGQNHNQRKFSYNFTVSSYCPI